MSRRIQIPAGRASRMRDVLFEEGVEFPCGGDGSCGACRIRLISGEIPVTPEMQYHLKPAELQDGWRLACCSLPVREIEVELGASDAFILSDEAALEVEARDGMGIAIDLGTTTLVVQSVDLRNGEILCVRSALNPQARYGADVMSRIQFDLERPGLLHSLIQDSVAGLIREVSEGETPREVLLGGNTVMHHLFFDNSVEPLAHVPFDSPHLGSQETQEGVAGLPCIGGFVGSDVLAGIIALGLHRGGRTEAMLDLGTNGEIVIAREGRLLCASTAAGPAFEAGRIRQGMRAASGAIDRVRLSGHRLLCHTLGGEESRGICGSGLVDAVAAGLAIGVIQPSGRFSGARKSWELTPQVTLVQGDVRELQLAQGAIVAGLRLLSRSLGIGLPDIEKTHLAGAFGNYIHSPSARRTGLLPEGIGTVNAAGNTALRGVRMLLLNPSRRREWVGEVLRHTRHISLSEEPGFQDAFVESMRFPG